MGGRETTPPPLQRSRRGEGGHPRGGRGGAGRPRPQLRPGDPAAHRGENNFSPAASASPAPVSGASIAPSDHQREILEEYALQMYMRIISPRTSRSGGREEKGILAAACVPREGILLMLSRVTIVGIFYHLEFLCLADLNSTLPVYGK